MKYSTIMAIGAVLTLTSCLGPHWKFGDTRYRVKGAQYARLGTVGEASMYGVTDFQPKMRPSLDGVPVLLAVETYQGVDSKTEMDVKLAATSGQLSGTVDADLLRERIQKGNYQIYKLAEVDHLVEKLRDQPRAIEWLQRKDARLITAVVVVYNDEQKRTLRAAGGVDAKAELTGSAGDPKLTLSGSTNRTVEVKVKDGYVIGYEMSAPRWANDKLIDFKVDKIGWGG